ncbi:MAG: undecaprenyl-diphosphatase [Parcubacteria bacterium C7867-007]|nr:MAG: undecaprenyl-diphosphatase [Parcubacteria bacterium C7867-007]
MTALDAIILGLLEGAAEFLPISSTGHLILASDLLAIPDSAFLTSFIIAIQFGAIAAVLITYWKSFLNIEVLKRLFVAFLPTAVIGFTLYPLIKDVLLKSELTVVIALFVGGILLIIFELLHKEPVQPTETDSFATIPYRKAFLVGLFQSIAVIPGVSRSAATIMGGLLLGIRRTAIVEFSFLLAVPTMGAATSYDLLKNYESFVDADIGVLAIGMVTAFITALLVLRLFLSFIKRYTFIPFGVYRIVLAGVFFFLVLY